MSTSEQTSPTQALLISIVVMALCLVAFNGALSHYAKTHFVFEVTFRDATAASSNSVVILGDSRMVQGVDPVLMNALLSQGGRAERVAYLPIGAVDLPGQALALRRFFRTDHEAALVVLGFSSTLLEPIGGNPRDPDDMIGNLALELSWSEANEVRDFFPGFPFRHTDAGLRFLLNRATALGSYRSAAWIKASTLRDKLTGQEQRPMNRFGAIEDMKLLVDSFANNSARALSGWNPGQKQGAWFEQIAITTESHGSRLLVVDVPMQRRYVDSVAKQPRFHEYSAALRDELRRGGISYADFGILEQATSEDFPDGIHLGPNGRIRFTQALAKVVIQELNHRGLPLP